ncbi:unnamed protein product [Cylindrotheca closterium]|uniref:Pentacotripeptide-repeat region of PRORP domain-containing protein n=1 Tax=Cylindrotheca closterium TaxID=2856 RepID=A0AAD2FSW6_9STRA|nr:unnamed protein product [Cylindrotheca closterium]
MRRRNTSIVFLCLTLVNGSQAFQSSQPGESVSSTFPNRRIRKRQLERNHFPASNSILYATPVVKATSRTSPASKTYKVEKKVTQLGRSGKTDEALELFHSVECPSTRLVNCAIDVCARSRPPRLEKAISILESAVNEKNLRVNVFTFGSLMNVCNRARNSTKALELLRSFEKEHRVAPNAVVYSSAISACARSHPPKTKQALDLLREAVEEKELEMSVTGFNAAISACAQAGDWKSAIKLLERMEGASEKNATTAEVESSPASKEEESDSGGDEMKKFLVPEPDFVTYGTILSACERGEQWPLVLTYAETMQNRGLELDGVALTSCLHACQQLGLAGEALEYLEQMKTVHPVVPITARLERSGAKQPLQGPDAVAYRLAISACARGGAWKDGIRLLQKFEQETGQQPGVVAYTAAITGCEYAGKWKEAFQLLDRMRKADVEPNEVTMAAVIGACANALHNGETERDVEATITNKPSERAGGSSKPLVQKKALQLLSLMKKMPDMVNPNIQVYNAAIRVCAEACDLKGAFKLLEEVEEAGIERTEITYGSMMTACQRVGDIQAASTVFQKLKEDGIAPNEIIYGAAISCCRKSKQSERALLLLRKMLKEGLAPNRATLNTVLMAQAEVRTKADFERAVTVYKLMKSRFVEETGRPNRQTYTILVNLFASCKQPYMAEAFLKRMREDGLKPDVDLFTATVASYERTGQPLKAVRLMESMQEDGYDFYSVKVLNSAFKKAIKLVNKVGKTLSSSEGENHSLKYVDLDVDIDEL